MQGRFAMAAAFAASLFLAQAQAQPLPQLPHSHRPYAIVRAELLRSGYRPVRFRHAEDSSGCVGDGRCVQYPEAVYCSGTGLAFCQFAFFRSRDRKYIVVTTAGEERLFVVRISIVSRRERLSWDPESH
jgi:hypothetical protein